MVEESGTNNLLHQPHFFLAPSFFFLTHDKLSCYKGINKWR
jgi:hypothetical protein